MPKILIENKIPFIKGRLEPFADVEYVSGAEFTPDRVKDADALLVRTRDRCNEALLGGSKVSLVATGTIGMDHIDVPWCESHGITVRNSAGCNAPGVAQYVLSSLAALHGDLKGLTLGVIGCGNVGSIVAEWAEAAGMNVMVCDPPREALVKAGRDRELPYTPKQWHTLDQVLTHADIVTLHTPLTRSGEHATYHLISDREMRLLGRKTLVNAARGPVTDTDALLSSDARLIIDTWEGEPALNRDLLRKAEIATPHIAGYSAEGKQRATRMITEAVAEKFGIRPDTSDLAPAYVPLNRLPNSKFSIETVSRSYDPMAHTAKLKANPEMFETFRETWPYRPEPKF